MLQAMKNLKLDGTVLNIPLYLADYADALITLTQPGRSWR